MLRVAFCVLAASVLTGGTAAAQDLPADESQAARIHLGPLRLNPTFVIRDLGIDTNVFNEAEEPRRDFTGTVMPGSQFWFRAGSLRLSGAGNIGYTYFRKYKSQAGWGGDLTGRLEVAFARLRPYVAADYSNTRDRIGYDLDVRSRHAARGARAGLDFLISQKTTVGVAVKQGRTRFAAEESELQGLQLRQAFDRQERGGEVSLRYRLTPLTTLRLIADYQQDRFVYNEERDSNTVRVLPGVEFNPFALISGTATFGFRRFNVLDARVQDYTGVIASAGLSYIMLEITRFEFRASRDVAYSYALEYPYYVTTEFGLTVTQKLVGPLDVRVSGDTQRMDYQGIGSAPAGVGGGVGGEAGPGAAEGNPAITRDERGRSYGGGIGWRLGRFGRLGFDVSSVRRTSPSFVREYEGLRYGVSFTYGEGR